jgi:CRP/FNR family transcriptional regulator, cyclic AMP receptor protein
MSLVPASQHLPYCRSGSGAFFNLPPETLAELDSISEPVEYSEGTTLMRQSDSPYRVKIPSKGRAKITTSSQDGKTLLLNITSAGAILGLASAIRRIKYETTVVAYGRCVVNEIHDQDFLIFSSVIAMQIGR